MNAHATENSKSFDKVLIVLGENVVVELVDELYHSDYLSRGIFYWHTEDGAMTEPCSVVY